MAESVINIANRYWRGSNEFMLKIRRYCATLCIWTEVYSNEAGTQGGLALVTLMSYNIIKPGTSSQKAHCAAFIWCLSEKGREGAAHLFPTMRSSNNFRTAGQLRIALLSFQRCRVLCCSEGNVSYSRRGQEKSLFSGKGLWIYNVKVVG